MQEGGEEETIPGIICDIARILHMHDSSSITSIPVPAPIKEYYGTWASLHWCRVKRCPNLECVFFTAPKSYQAPDTNLFQHLGTFWASRLLKAHCIWNWVTPILKPEYGALSFKDLAWLRLDFCLWLIRILSTKVTLRYHWYDHITSLNNLHTLEITWCGALREVFSLYVDGRHNNPVTVRFGNLRHIHLHELPILQGICGHSRIVAPWLETVKIKGC